MTQESTSSKDNDQRVKDAMNNLSQTQSYQSFVSLFPNLAKGGLANNQVPSSIPMMFKKGESAPEIEEIEEKVETVKTNPVVVREGEKVQEVELEHGQTVFSLDNQDGKLLVDNFMSEDASEYTIDNHLPNSTINSFDPLSSYSPSSYVPSVQQLDDKIIKQEKQENEKEEKENAIVNWDGGFTIASKREKPKTNKTTIESQLIMESFDDEDEIVQIQNTETIMVSDVLDNTESTQNSDNAEFIEVEKFSIDDDFDYDNIVLARKYSPETERRLNGRFNEFEEQLSKLNVNKN